MPWKWKCNEWQNKRKRRERGEGPILPRPNDGGKRREIPRPKRSVWAKGNPQTLTAAISPVLSSARDKAFIDKQANQSSGGKSHSFPGAIGGCKRRSEHWPPLYYLSSILLFSPTSNVSEQVLSLSCFRTSSSTTVDRLRGTLGSTQG